MDVCDIFKKKVFCWLWSRISINVAQSEHNARKVFFLKEKAYSNKIKIFISFSFQKILKKFTKKYILISFYYIFSFNGFHSESLELVLDTYSIEKELKMFHIQIKNITSIYF